MKAIAITGLGIVSSVASDINAFLRAIRDVRTPNFTKSIRIDLDIDIIVAEAADSCFTEPKNRLFDNPTSRLLLTAARECFNDFLQSGGQKPDALIVGTSTGGQKVCEDFVFSYMSGQNDISLNYRAQGTMASPTRLIASELEIEGRVNTVSTACTSSANAIALGCSMIDSGRASAVLTGGGDALCATTMSGFHILGLTGHKPCRPFGPNRPGMTLGDGAAFLMLEPLENVLADARPYYAEIMSYGYSSDAFSMTSPSENGEGAYNAMKSALIKAHIEPELVDYINAHGTGTIHNDRSEALAIQHLFGDKKVSSLKGLLGHTLAGAGAIEAVASVLAVREMMAWENFNSYECDKDCPVNLVPEGGFEFKENPLVLSNSFAFGGNNCSLLFGRPKR
ncbi:MAG: beta-ketoacyl-[acyl-carrier-protein] synthase family protein [Spirochaetota bacterium]|nr:beta-ketoacyl-[acyl-carrier-protein] synthase family protein [Spirochaetota bacterium]